MSQFQKPPRGQPRPFVFVCDLQEKFRNAIWEFDKVILTTKKLLQAAQALSIPVVATTQNKARLGETVPELAPLLAQLGAHEEDKTLFSMYLPAVAERLLSPSSPSQAPADVAIVGIESHICVTQTALDLLRAGHNVYVLADGVSSCNRQEVGLALDRLRCAGAVVTTSESWLYDMMRDAARPEFRAVAGVVKATKDDTQRALSGLFPGPGPKM